MVEGIHKGMGTRPSTLIFHTLFWLCLSSHISLAVESDIECLKSLKNSLEDPNDYLSSWVFNNSTEGFICYFKGIECWHPDENRVLHIMLSNMSLKGDFPLALKNCTSLTALDLSLNRLSGSLPPDIDLIIPNITTLNLSSNSFSGHIPQNISNCSYLNFLDLQNNRLTGQIPRQLLQNPSLKSLSLENNLGLCGPPLDACVGPRKPHAGVIAGEVVGGILLGSIIVRAYMLFGVRDENEGDLEGNKQAKRNRGTRHIKVTVPERSVPKIRLIDIKKATNNFSRENIIGCGEVGIMYRAMLPDGSWLAVKRMRESFHSNKRFVTETTILGRLKHRNIIPLLGFCIARQERILVYKFMHRGTLYQQLHQPEDRANVMQWPVRLRVAIGVARGLTWLHNNCSPSIIHRNISSRSILLDEEYEPVISSFKSARLMGSVANSIFGSAGYVAPEYVHSFESIPKGDVYSFGVVLLELVTGKDPARTVNCGQCFKGSLVEWMEFLSNNHCLSDAIDESLIGRDRYIELFEFITIAYSCVVPDPGQRPTIFEVYRLLRAMGKSYKLGDEEEIETSLNRIESNYAYLIMMPQEIPEIR